jgi:hypothetical protein
MQLWVMLRDDDLDVIDGHLEELGGRFQEWYG